MPQMSAIICTYNRYDYLHSAIESLRAQTLPIDDIEILVIDNTFPNPKQLTLPAQYAHVPNLKYIIVDKAGLSNARNVGVSLANSEIVGFIDDDASASPDWAHSILSAFSVGGEQAIVCGGPVRPIFETERPAWLHDALLKYLSVVNLGDKFKELDSGEWLAGVNICFRKAAYIEAGGCDENLGRVGDGQSLMSNEEIALLNKIKSRGGKLFYTPGAEVSHVIPTNRLNREWFRRRVIWQAISDEIMAPLEADEISQYEKWIMEYMPHVPARYRTTRALFFEAEDSNLFIKQLNALYPFIRVICGTGRLFQ